jgi:hypothetical protein
MADITRRTIAKGAAWALPVVAVGAAAPALAASPPEDPCSLVLLPGSFKCCANGPDKTMYLNLQIGQNGSCTSTDVACIVDVQLSNGQPIGLKTIDGVPLDGQTSACVAVGQPFTVLLQDVQSCAADLLFIDDQGNTKIVKSGNIPGGDENECVTRAGG